MFIEIMNLIKDIMQEIIVLIFAEKLSTTMQNQPR